MKLKVILIFVFFLVLLNIVFLKDYITNMSWVFLYNKWLYEDSKLVFDKLDNLEWVYNKANSNYKLWTYSWALNLYESINCEEKSKCFFIKNNLWNTYFRLSQEEKLIEKQKEFLELSILNYKEALKIKYDKKTEKNLEFVLDILDNLKQEENNKSDEKSKENKEGDSDSWEDDNWENKDETSWENTWEGASDWDDSNTEPSSINWNNWLTQEQLDAIDKYEKTLEQDQKNVWNYYNKVYEEQNNIDSSFEAFFWNNPFFDNSVLDENNNKKDW